MIRRRHRHAPDISGCQVYACDRPFDAAATLWFLFATLRDTISVSVSSSHTRKEDHHTLILRLLQLVQPPLDLLCDRRGFDGIPPYNGVSRYVSRMEGSEAGGGKHEIRNTQYASIDCGCSSSVRPPPPAEPNSAFLLTVITGYSVYFAQVDLIFQFQFQFRCSRASENRSINISTVTFLFDSSQVRSFRIELNTSVTSSTLALVERNWKEKNPPGVAQRSPSLYQHTHSYISIQPALHSSVPLLLALDNYAIATDK